MGSAKVAQLRAAFELGQRLLEGPHKQGPVFSPGEDVYEYYTRLKNLKKEVFRCAMLDAKNRMFRDCRVSEGTLTESLIHPREAFRMRSGNPLRRSYLCTTTRAVIQARAVKT